MKTETFKEVKAISLLFGFMHLFGYLFVGNYYLTGSFIHILFVTSTGLALLVLPLISDRLLQIKVIKVLVLFIGTIGIINNIHEMVKVLPEIDVLIIRVVVLVVLSIMIRGIVAPKHLYEDLWKKRGSDKTEENEERNF